MTELLNAFNIEQFFACQLRMQSDKERQGYSVLVQRKRNAGTRKNVELKKAMHINYKHHKPDHIHPSSSTSTPNSISVSTEASPKTFQGSENLKPMSAPL